jgi:hypothetical protein
MHLFQVALIFSLLALTACATPESASITPQPGAAYANFTPDGAWCWFADPRGVYYEGQHRRTYMGWVDADCNVKIGYYDHDTQQVTIEATPLRERIRKNNGPPDDHCNPALHFLPDGRLMVLYSPHGGNPMWYRISRNPEDITSWQAEQTLPTNTEGDRGYTYPNPVQLSDEDNKLYLFWRGANFKPNFSTSTDNGATWAEARTMVMGEGARPYVKYATNGVDRIHIAFTDGHPRNETQNSIYYVSYYNDAFYRADGSKIKDMADLPMEPADADRVYDATQIDARGWIWDIAIDAEERPVIVYSASPEETDHRYRYARWTGSEWLDVELTTGGGWFPQTQPGKTEREPHYSGGIYLDHTNPSIVYLSRPINGVFEIEQWTTPDAGRTWTSQAITAGSSKNNVRPFVPRNYPGGPGGVFWMYGDYIHYTNYHTAIKMK